ncbi:MAG: DUF1122 family protein [Chloroflexota bacterium]|nr:DUF1122 family protein [Chloroflexota bacterium]
MFLGPANRAGARYFQLRKSSDGAILLAGLHHTGPYPGHNWVEVISSEASPAQEERVFRYLAALIAPGGHIMVEYESPARRETERALVAGVPPPLTPLGAALLRAGFSAGFKDWYIAEGWSEGPRKLQAYRPMHAAHQREKARAMLAEVESYLATAGSAAAPAKRAEDVEARLRALAR